MFDVLPRDKALEGGCIGIVNGGRGRVCGDGEVHDRKMSERSDWEASRSQQLAVLVSRHYLLKHTCIRVSAGYRLGVFLYTFRFDLRSYISGASDHLCFRLRRHVAVTRLVLWVASSLRARGFGTCMLPRSRREFGT